MTQENIALRISATDNTSRGIASASRNLTKLQGTTRATTRQMRASFSQLGYQVQDIAVQLQGGQNAMLVLGQQGSQIASIFGVWGALAGGAIATVAAVISGVSKETGIAKTAAEEYAGALEALNKSTETAKNGQIVLAEEIAKTTEVSVAAANIQIEIALQKFKTFQISTASKIKELLESSNIKPFGLESIFDDLKGASLKATLGMASYQDELTEMAKKAGVADHDLDQFLTTLNEIQTSPSVRAFKDFSYSLAEIAAASNDSGLKKFSNEVSVLVNKLIDAKPKADELEQSLKNLPGALLDRATAIGQGAKDSVSKGIGDSFNIWDVFTEGSEEVAKVFAQNEKIISGLWKSVATPQEAYELKLKEIAQLHEDITLPANLRDRLEQKAWEDLQKSLDKTKDKYSDVFKELKDASNGWRRDFTNALVDGEKSINSFTDNLLDSFAKIAVQKAITDPLFDFFEVGLESILPSIFGGGRALGGPVDPGKIYEVNETGNPELLNIGSQQYLMMGQDPGFVSPIGTTPSLGAFRNGSPGADKAEVKMIVNVIEDPSRAGESDRRTDGSNNIIDVFVESVKRSISSDISTGRGALPRTLQSVYGLSRTPGGF